MKGCPNDREVDDRSGRSHRRVLRGDVEAFSRIIEEYSPRMLRLALGIVRRQDAAEDVVQDALVKAYERLGSWRGDSALSTWLYRIVYTTAVSSLRSSGRDILEPGVAMLSDTAADDGGDWEITEASIARMRLALEQLAPLDRTLVTLFHLEDRSVRDVAAICGESESNVKTRLHRARSRLRKLMDDGKER
ncbi:MAG: RNA polymerase sigma factor [Alistipes sp.]|jgi:RNA polymerase sigma-70 factor (ECF subfamily)|nr:RNA polymerase sigma factor [Alistipes sp.]